MERPIRECLNGLKNITKSIDQKSEILFNRTGSEPGVKLNLDCDCLSTLFLTIIFVIKSNLFTLYE